jgi:translation initiation factor 1
MSELENAFDEIKIIQIHIRIKQRKAKSYITLIENLPGNKDNILKLMKKTFCCNGTTKSGIIQLSGDHREAVKKLLLQYNVCDEDDIITHGI